MLQLHPAQTAKQLCDCMNVCVLIAIPALQAVPATAAPLVASDHSRQGCCHGTPEQQPEQRCSLWRHLLAHAEEAEQHPGQDGPAAGVCCFRNYL
jgi:hypothetical protein